MLSRFSRVRLFTSLCTVARRAPLSMGFPRQEYWSGLPFLSPGDCPRLLNCTPISWLSCNDKQILYHWVAWEALQKDGSSFTKPVLFPQVKGSSLIWNPWNEHGSDSLYQALQYSFILLECSSSWIFSSLDFVTAFSPGLLLLLILFLYVCVYIFWSIVGLQYYFNFRFIR